MSVHQTKRTELILSGTAVADLEEFAAEVGVRDDCGLLLIGEGTGGTDSDPAGWGCIAYDRERRRAILHAGATTTGGARYARLVPYVHALWHHHASQGDKHARLIRVAIVGDGLADDRCGGGEYRHVANDCLWAAIDWFAAHGYELEWHHMSWFTKDWGKLVYDVADTVEKDAKDRKGNLRRGLRYWL